MEKAERVFERGATMLMQEATYLRVRGVQTDL